MATHETFNIDCFWDLEYKFLRYQKEDFNNPNDVSNWLNLGYNGNFTGSMCDMRQKQPTWNYKFVNFFTSLGWQDIGTSYYRMETGTILPVHQDTYKRYIQLFDLHNRAHTIRRAIVFLEDWASGHYFEIDNVAITNWTKGFCQVWEYDVPHMAANIGITPRYTLQVTGHI